MSLSVSFYRSVYSIGRPIATAAAVAADGIVATFNFVSGQSALHARGLRREPEWFDNTGLWVTLAGAASSIGGLAAIASMFPAMPVSLGLPLIAELGFLPAQLNAAYKIGKYEDEKQAEQVKQATALVAAVSNSRGQG